jgi:hypothetical protein
MKPCSRCGQLFRAIHGNQLYCTSCRLKRPLLGRHRYTTATSFGRRICVYCGRAYEARADNQRFCSQRCKDRAKPVAVKAKYARSSHRLGRKAWAPLVAKGLVRCARGSDCKRAEYDGGKLVGGFIRGPWDLGHPDLQSTGGPECRECNRATAGRRRAAHEGSRIW